MASETLNRIQKVLSRMVTTPMERVVAELQEIANGDRDNPEPQLVMAVVTGFANQNFDEAEEHLNAAANIIERNTGQPNETEWAFSQHLFQALRSDAVLIRDRKQRSSFERPTEENRARLMRATVASKQALAKMRQLMPRLRDAPAAGLIYNVLLTHSFANGPNSDQYKSGMRGLGRMFGGQNELSDLAGFFQLYGYRKRRDYRRAIGVGQKLSERHPNSSLMQVTLGSCYYFANNLKQAQVHYQKAVSLAPNLPSAHLGLANVMAKQNQIVEARDLIRRARELDTSGRLEPHLRSAEITTTLRERFGPDLEP